jgi:hypothetical protein
MMEALGSSEMSVLTRATRRKIPEDSVLPSRVLEFDLSLHQSQVRPEGLDTLIKIIHLTGSGSRDLGVVA